MKTKSIAQQANSEIKAKEVSQVAVTNSSKTTPDTAAEEHMIPGKMYFDIIDPDTGKFINPDNPKYFYLKRQFGGDAGIVSPYESKACAPVIEEWRKKQATKH